MSLMLHELLSYAAMGWHLFPLAPNSKVPPKGSHGVSDATNDVKQIAEWHGSCPDANWAIATGPSNLIVLDVDAYKPGVADVLTALELEHGVPKTLTVATPNGGRHHYYLGTAATTASKIGPGIDTRGVGGYVVAPGSTLDGSR